MPRSSFHSPYHQGAEPGPASKRTSMRNARDAADFLRAHDRMASLLPAVARLVSLQKDCAAVLPDMFTSCEVLQFESEQLILTIPNAALAAKLKQKLPKLKVALEQRGWQVSSIRLRVQVRRPLEQPVASKQLAMPTKAISALATLSESLENSPRNAALKTALDALIKRQQERKRSEQ
jgi:Dna[CI] antecedent, DciA